MRTRITFLALAVLLGVAACATDPGAPGTSPDDSGTAGDTPSSSASSNAAPSAPEGVWGNPENTREPSLELHGDGRLTGTDGCNRLMGHWTQDGATVTLIDMASTMMFCQEIDTWLSAAATAEIDGETLALFNENGDPIGTLQR